MDLSEQRIQLTLYTASYSTKGNSLYPKHPMVSIALSVNTIDLDVYICVYNRFSQERLLTTVTSIVHVKSIYSCAYVCVFISYQRHNRIIQLCMYCTEDLLLLATAESEKRKV